MKKFSIIGDDKFYSDYSTSESDGEGSDIEIKSKINLDSKSDDSPINDIIHPNPYASEVNKLLSKLGDQSVESENDFYPPPLPSDEDEFNQYEYDEESENEPSPMTIEEGEAEQENDTATSHTSIPSKRPQAEEDVFVRAVKKIYYYFNKNIPYDIILNAIHSNYGSIQGAIFDLAQDPGQFISISLSSRPAKNVTIGQVLSYTSR
ncbi:hypothetical protein GPJ56_000852 [Histomonas meleagridis]|uniref:uncharacterized protein n=1 Tax=Histomonas meleagridis TaxID=135588 RepID=UPI00355A8DA1|nr:hypothetical protein GPJ56_000852 [Histomonas meleagridis]KAH0801316.1 hypothetical protein GO595_005911 [Histomonas meleagridis]